MIRADIDPYMILQRRAVADLRVTHFYQAPKSATPRHYHENATLCVLLRGAARDHFPKRTVEYGPGAVIYRPPGERHSHEYGDDGSAAIVIEIPASRLSSDSALHFLSEPRFKPDAPTLGESVRLLNDLRNRVATEADLEEHCLSLLTIFNLDGADASGSHGVERVRTLLDDCFIEKHSLAKLAALAELHPAYLVNAFRKRFGCSIGQYRKRQRVALAVKQIWNTRSTLSQIALETGFYDQSHCTNDCVSTCS